MERNQIQSFFTWRSAILKSDLPPNCRLLLLTISCHMNEANPSAFPSQPTLSKETGLGSSTVAKYLISAEEEGWLIIERRSRSNGACSSNMYYPTTPTTPRETEGVPPERRRGTPRETEGNVNSPSNSFKKTVTKKEEVLIKKADRVITYLNTVTGKAFRFSNFSRTNIIARLRDGATYANCITVIDNKKKDKHFIDHPQFLNPETLFRPTKFDGYLNDIPLKKPKGEKSKHKESKKWVFGGVTYDEDDPNLSDDIKQKIKKEKQK